MKKKSIIESLEMFREQIENQIADKDLMDFDDIMVRIIKLSDELE